jgi:hypothetical protein
MIFLIGFELGFAFWGAPLAGRTGRRAGCAGKEQRSATPRALTAGAGGAYFPPLAACGHWLKPCAGVLARERTNLAGSAGKILPALCR